MFEDNGTSGFQLDCYCGDEQQPRKKNKAEKGNDYIKTRDDGTPAYNHIVQVPITVDENGIKISKLTSAKISNAT